MQPERRWWGEGGLQSGMHVWSFLIFRIRMVISSRKSLKYLSFRFLKIFLIWNTSAVLKADGESKEFNLLELSLWRQAWHHVVVTCCPTLPWCEILRSPRLRWERSLGRDFRTALYIYMADSWCHRPPHLFIDGRSSWTWMASFTHHTICFLCWLCEHFHVPLIFNGESLSESSLIILKICLERISCPSMTCLYYGTA